MYKTQVNGLLDDLYESYTAIWNIENEIDRLKEESIKENAIHKVGDVVEVYDEDGSYVGDGVVEDIRTSLFVGEALCIKRYIDNPEDVLKDIEKIRYEILGLNKNGTKSKKHHFGNQHYFYDVKDITERYSRYIKTKNNGHTRDNA